MVLKSPLLPDRLGPCFTRLIFADAPEIAAIFPFDGIDGFPQFGSTHTVKQKIEVRDKATGNVVSVYRHTVKLSMTVADTFTFSAAADE